MVATTEGMEKKMQATEVIIVKKPIGKILSHFMTMLVTHQIQFLFYLLCVGKALDEKGISPPQLGEIYLYLSPMEAIL